MKKLLLLSMLVAITSCGVMVPIDHSSFEAVVETPGTSEVLFVRANNWMVENFTNAESVIQFTDKESGTVTGKYHVGTAGGNYIAITGTTTPIVNVRALIKVRVRDNGAKIEIDPMPYNINSEYKGHLSEANVALKMKAMLQSFREYMVQVEETFQQ
jgi:hypothetical protein